MKVLVTGGSGLLGTELKAQRSEWYYPARSILDVTNFDKAKKEIVMHKPDKVLHCAALTSPPVCDQNKDAAIQVNKVGTENLVKICSAYDIPLIYISTDYVFDGLKEGGMYKENDLPHPVNFYAVTKRLGEVAVENYPNGLIIRTSFCSKDKWPYPGAFIDKFTSFDTVDVIAKEIIKAVRKDILGLIHIGTTRKSFYDLAKRLSPEVKEMSIQDVQFNVPPDTSLDSSKWRGLRVG